MLSLLKSAYISQRSHAVLFLNVRLTAGVVQVHRCVQPGSVGV